MDTEKIIKKIAAQEGVPAWHVRFYMQEAIDRADWSKCSPNGVKPETMEKALKLIAKQALI